MSIEIQLQRALELTLNEEHDSLSDMVCRVHTSLVGRAINLLKQAGFGADIAVVQSFELVNNKLGVYEVKMTFTPSKKHDSYTLSLKSKVKKEAILSAFINQCRVIAQPLLNAKTKREILLEALSEHINNDDGYSGVRTYVDYRDMRNLLIRCQVKKEFEMLLSNNSRTRQKKDEEWAWAQW